MALAGVEAEKYIPAEVVRLGFAAEIDLHSFVHLSSFALFSQEKPIILLVLNR